MIEFKKGDVLDSNADVICHQVNCQGVMGAGLAKQVRSRYPAVYTAYRNTCNTTSKHELLGTVLIVRISDTQSIANIFGQYAFGTDRRHTDYTALRKALSKLNICFAGKTIALPHGIGCGLAGGDWNAVLSIIDSSLTDCKVQIYSLR